MTEYPLLPRSRAQCSVSGRLELSHGRAGSVRCIRPRAGCHVDAWQLERNPILRHMVTSCCRDRQATGRRSRRDHAIRGLLLVRVECRATGTWGAAGAGLWGHETVSRLPNHVEDRRLHGSWSSRSGANLLDAATCINLSSFPSSLLCIFAH